MRRVRLSAAIAQPRERVDAALRTKVSVRVFNPIAATSQRFWQLPVQRKRHDGPGTERPGRVQANASVFDLAARIFRTTSGTVTGRGFARRRADDEVERLLRNRLEGASAGTAGAPTS